MHSAPRPGAPAGPRRLLPWWPMAAAAVLAALMVSGCTSRAASPAPGQASGTLSAPAGAATAPAGAATAGTPLPTPTLPLASDQPSPSALPQGAVVVYLDKDGLEVLEPTGPRLLAKDKNTNLILPSPNGLWVAYRLSNIDRQCDEIKVVGVSSGQTAAHVVLLDLPGAGKVQNGRLALGNIVSQMDWNPAGDRLYFSTQAVMGSEAANTFVRVDDLWTIDPAGGNTEQLLPPGKGGTFTFSLDGSMMALTTPPSDTQEDEVLAVAAADGTGWRELYRHPGIKGGQGPSGSGRPTWADGDQSLLVCVLENVTDMASLWKARGQLVRVWLDGRQERVSDLSGLALTFKNGYGLRTSPDGSAVGAGLPPVQPTPAGTPPPPTPTAQGDIEHAPRPERLLALPVSTLAATGWDAAPVYDQGYWTFLESWSPDGQSFLYSMERTADDPEGGALHVGHLGGKADRIVGNWRLLMPYWLTDDRLLLVLDEGQPWLVLATTKGVLTVLAKLDLTGLPSDHPVVGVASSAWQPAR